MNRLLNMQEFTVTLNEMARMKERKCPQIDWDEVRSLPIYRDATDIGWVDETTMYKEKLANMTFSHPLLPGKLYKINRNGQLRTETPGGRSDRISIPGEHSERLEQECLKAEDYEVKLDYLVKIALRKMGLMDEKDILSVTPSSEILTKRIKTEIKKNSTDFMSKINKLPYSIRQNDFIRLLYQAYKKGV
jgi:hypothetical protein